MGLMERMNFLLPDPIPTHVAGTGFCFEVLHPSHVELDFDALMKNKEFLRRWSNSNWPEDEFTLEDNLRDLEWHFDEFKELTAFTYTILNHSKTQCWGCIYIRPVVSIQSLSPDDLRELQPYQFFVSYWVIAGINNTAMENQIFTTLLDWLLTEWHFPSVLFASNRQISEQNKLYQNNKMALYLEIEANIRYQLFWTPIKG